MTALRIIAASAGVVALLLAATYAGGFVDRAVVAVLFERTGPLLAIVQVVLFASVYVAGSVLLARFALIGVAAQTSLRVAAASGLVVACALAVLTVVDAGNVSARRATYDYALRDQYLKSPEFLALVAMDNAVARILPFGALGQIALMSVAAALARVRWTRKRRSEPSGAA